VIDVMMAVAEIRSVLMIRGVVCVCFVVFASATAAADSDRYVRKLALPDGQTAVIAEGDFEARSIGTYTVRLYSPDSTKADDTTFYTAGVILERDGMVEDVRVADLDGKGEELVVIVRSAGTGGYLSAQALSFANKGIEVRSHVEGLPKDADPVAALTHTTRVDKVKGTGKYHDPNSGAR
jgi:hypothetical protein